MYLIHKAFGVSAWAGSEHALVVQLLLFGSRNGFKCELETVLSELNIWHRSCCKNHLRVKITGN
jgi:hypothetical protein